MQKPATSKFWGTGGQYKYLHKWVASVAGKPSKCEHCGKTEGKFEWANKTGKYLQDVNDWLRLCRSCHRIYDDAKSTHKILQPKTHCKNGHEFTQDNTKIVSTGKGRAAKRCVICVRAYWRKQYYERKLKCLTT